MKRRGVPSPLLYRNSFAETSVGDVGGGLRLSVLILTNVLDVLIAPEGPGLGPSALDRTPPER